MSRPGVDGTATDKDIEAELFDGLCQADADQFRADNRLGLERIRMKEGNGAPLYMRDMMRSDKPHSTATSEAQLRTPERPAREQANEDFGAQTIRMDGTTIFST